MNKIQLITRDFGSHLIDKMEEADTVCVLSSFVMKSGVKFIREAMKKAAQNGADIKICTGDYLYITQPNALEELLSIGAFDYGKVMVFHFIQKRIFFNPMSMMFFLLVLPIFQILL